MMFSRKGWIKIAVTLFIGIGLVIALGQSDVVSFHARKGVALGKALVGIDLSAQSSVPFRGRPFIRFAAIGDFGDSDNDAATRAVADMVKSWNPDFVITVGDNNYPDGAADTLDDNVGQYYSQFIYPYQGNYAPSEPPNRFFPVLGNHDWGSRNIQPYLDYFPINTSTTYTGSSGNERYYDFIEGPVHFFALDSDSREPDGYTGWSPQAQWLRKELTDSVVPWQLVFLHHAPYSSGARHGSSESLQWAFASWGVDAVIAGHDHVYERIEQDNIPYFVNGLGGRPLRGFGSPVAGSQVRYSDDYGAMLIEATPDEITFSFYAVADGGTLIDSYTLSK